MSSAASDRSLMVRAEVGFTAQVLQHQDLRLSRIVVDRPVLILLRQGTKIIEGAGGRWIAHGGEAIAIAGGGTFDVTNRLSESNRYEASWLVWDPALIRTFAKDSQGEAPLTGAAALGRIDQHFRSAFDRAVEAIADARHVPLDVAKHRLVEILHWLKLRGVHFSPIESQSLAMRVRHLIEGAVADKWTAAEVAQRLALSEATLRRRLAADGASLSDILTDARMSYALLLLQSTHQPINRIALEVGYESASRFAIRFRDRFGFPPTAVRSDEKRRATMSAS